MEEITRGIIGLLISLKDGRLQPVVLDEFLRTMQFLWNSGMFACANNYNLMSV